MTKVVSEQRLLDAGWVPYKAVVAGTAVMYVSSDYPKGYRHRDRDDVKGELVPQTVILTQPVVNGTFDAGPPLCTVNGKPVKELAVLVKPVGLFVTTDAGNHEITRMFFHGGKFLYGSGLERLGGVATTSVEYVTTEGMYIHMERGYEMFLPASHCQATWKK